jgi:type VI secretion system protein ImpA
MSKQAALALKETALTNGEGLNFLKWEESKSFDFPDNLDALEYEQKQKAEQVRQQANEENRVTGAMWRAAKAQGNRAFYETMFLTLEESWTEFNALDAVMDEKFGNQTPGLGALKKSLDDVHTLVKTIVAEKRLLEPDAIEEVVQTIDETSAATNGAGSAATAVATSGGALRTRQDALRRLTEVADYFRQSEPHSPVSYLVQKAVKWGNMPLDDWLQEVVKDETTLGQLKEVLGVTKQPSDGTS